MKNILIIVFAIIYSLNPMIGNACSMYKITKNGKTIVGNNEDWLSPNHQFWFESGSKNKFGVMYMGQLNNFAQGAINEKGLLFDGFFEPNYLPVNNTAGKVKIPIADALRKLMQTMTHVEEVKAYIETINLATLTKSMLVFVDKSGTYLIIEGDEIFIGDEAEKTFSNFYYSQIESVDNVNLDYYQNGRKFINSSNGQATLDYCGEAMSKFAQAKTKLAATQYSTIYDLEKLIVRVYLFNDHSKFIEIDLKKDLKKGNHKTMIPDLFPKESLGYKHYLKYNNENHPTLFIEELIGNEKISEEEFNAMGFGSIINPIGYEWLLDKKNPKAAIKIFEYGITLMPNNSNLYDSLGESYFANNDWSNAIKSYAKSLYLNSENENAIKMILKSKEKRTEFKVNKS
ncbi:linear amide C-N hydrolase [Lutibacter citreus]|uniref:linear amide C-N hydrolase n=1 Tax=Lutibacter citreus TaxID=2138210 RepID=UPI000DBE4D62|nr:linear amide C-N hydrolase [Lutibacter citreus]